MQTQTPTKKPRVTAGNPQDSTDPSKGMLKLSGSANCLPRFNNLQAKHHNPSHLAKICAHFIIQGKLFTYKDRYNTSHVTVSSRIKDKEQRNTFIDHALQNNDLSFINEQDTIKATGTP